MNAKGLQKKVKSTKKKDTPQREHDRWVAKRSAARRDYKFVKVRAKLHEEDVKRKRQIKTVADFLKQQTEHGAPVKPDPPPRAIPTKRHRLAYKTPTPSTSRETVYETPTPQPLSIKRDDDDDDVSTDDQ